jgi:branched-chain amino acid transport system permease protein
VSVRPPALSIWLLGAALLLAVPPFLGTYHVYLLNLVLVNVIVAVGLNLLTGNAGLISLCQSSFMAIGAYATTLSTTRLGIPCWIGLVGGGAVAAGFGCMLAVPAMRLGGFYLALATLGFLEITQILIEQLSGVTGGVRGLMVPRPTLFGATLSTDVSLYYAVLPVAAGLLLIARNLLRSGVGRAFDAIRNSPAAAQTLGISLARTKVLAFALSACYAGVAGGIGAMIVGFIDPTEYGATASLRAITFIVVGGMGSIAGSVIGATLLTILPEALRGAKEFSDLLYAMLLLGFLVFMPRGLVGLIPWPRSRLSARGTTGRPEMPAP